MKIFTKKQVSTLMAWFEETGTEVPVDFENYIKTTKKEMPKKEIPKKEIPKKEMPKDEMPKEEPVLETSKKVVYCMDPQKKLFYVHRRKAAKPIVDSDGIFCCPLCPKKFKKHTSWSFHYTHVHSREFQCPHEKCDKTFGIVSNVLQHYSRKHIGKGNFTVKQENGSKKFDCNKCFKTFSSEPGIHSHITKCFGHCLGVSYKSSE